MKVLRTPDECFTSLPGFPYEPQYTTIKAEDGTDLRIHHVDEGPKDGPTVLCMHGQPAWSYLYRKMIPRLVQEGMRVIAPDLVGYGRSDKPAAREDYSFQRQVDWMDAWLAQNDFSNLTFFGQDWGGLIGLRMVADHGDRFDRVVISNTGLPVPTDDVPEDVVREVKDFRANAKTPTLIEMGRALQNVPGKPASAFAYWQKFCWETEDLPIGFIMSMGAEGPSPGLALSFLLHWLGVAPLRPRSVVGCAYDAPFPDPSYKMGPRAMPSYVPTLPDDPSIEAQEKAWAFFESFDKPFVCAFADDDPVTKGGARPFLDRIPGTRGQAHATLPSGGHFVQERCPAELVKIIVDLIRSTNGQ